MESFVVTKTGHHMDIPDGSYVKLLNFAYKGNKPSSVVLKVYNEKEEELRAILCTLTPENPQYFAEIIVAGPSADFELIGDDEITVYMDIDFDDITKFEDDDDDDMTFSDMEDSDDEEEEEEPPKKEALKKEEKKPQPPKQEKKSQPKKEVKQQPKKEIKQQPKKEIKQQPKKESKPQPPKKQFQENENKKKNKKHGKK
ncbi:FK506-binding protein, putative [Entamoeba dispar SAW760]|uniref:FK506-binding protein, putative n=1 Tax=Entamoeba dispar (strain ATCC PRA-260 / SAW760) TaxID=370354 RepID=B0EHF6_ENTDS|nr:FK506-binding protein, putative [Entamoeba dispar SAW760]EDR26022.1 FK506-binding protein, putative [Entamoeba dispar SAW760]|eukprot:EDR26022.1 FK506-binding protein, putative [Entamoeba dispar SAW760]